MTQSVQLKAPSRCIECHITNDIDTETMISPYAHVQVTMLSCSACCVHLAIRLRTSTSLARAILRSAIVDSSSMRVHWQGGDSPQLRISTSCTVLTFRCWWFGFFFRPLCPDMPIQHAHLHVCGSFSYKGHTTSSSCSQASIAGRQDTEGNQLTLHVHDKPACVHCRLKQTPPSIWLARNLNMGIQQHRSPDNPHYNRLLPCQRFHRSRDNSQYHISCG